MYYLVYNKICINNLDSCDPTLLLGMRFSGPELENMITQLVEFRPCSTV